MDDRQSNMPGYVPPTVRERLAWEANLPYSGRRQRAAKARPIAVGLFDEDGRSQLDLIDAIRAEQAYAQCDAE